MSRTPVTVLISGRGSNMMALVEAAADTDCAYEVVGVISNRPDAKGLAWAAERGIPTVVVDHKAFPNRAQFEAALEAAIEASGARLVALAGFMRLLGAPIVERYAGRMLNIHPSLLPAYKGLHTHARALADGVRITGCTVHFVVPEMDAGPIIAQAAVPVEEGDTPNRLADRVLAAEHRLYPHALALVASGRARLEDGRVRIRGAVHQSAQLISPPLPFPP